MKDELRGSCLEKTILLSSGIPPTPLYETGAMGIFSCSQYHTNYVKANEKEIGLCCPQRHGPSAASPSGEGEELIVRKAEFAGNLVNGALRFQKLEEVAYVLGQKHVLVEDDFPVGNLPLSTHLPQGVLPAAHVKVLLGLRPVPVHQEVGVDR